MRPYFYRLQCLVGAAFLLMAPSHLFAAVTYGGSEGVQAQVFFLSVRAATTAMHRMVAAVLIPMRLLRSTYRQAVP
jgi:hypothetical protein